MGSVKNIYIYVFILSKCFPRYLKVYECKHENVQHVEISGTAAIKKLTRIIAE